MTGSNEAVDWVQFCEEAKLEKHTTCPICGNAEKLTDFNPPHDDDRFQSPRLFTLCPVCFVIYFPYRITDKHLDEYYKRDYRDHYNPDFPNERHYAIEDARTNRQMSIIGNLAGVLIDVPCDVLDIGCALGTFLVKMRERFGCRVTGVDPAVQCHDALRERQIPFVTRLEELDKKFDFVMMSHLFEHLPDPIGYLTNLRQYIRPRGWLFIEVPHAGKKSGWSASHLFVYKKENLGIALNKAGFYPWALIDMGHKINWALARMGNDS